MRLRTNDLKCDIVHKLMYSNLYEINVICMLRSYMFLNFEDAKCFERKRIHKINVVYVYQISIDLDISYMFKFILNYCVILV